MITAHCITRSLLCYINALVRTLQIRCASLNIYTLPTYYLSLSSLNHTLIMYYLSLSLSHSLSVCLSVSLFLCVCLSVCLSQSLSLSLALSRSRSLSLFLSVCLSRPPSFSPFLSLVLSLSAPSPSFILLSQNSFSGSEHTRAHIAPMCNLCLGVCFVTYEKHSTV